MSAVPSIRPAYNSLIPLAFELITGSGLKLERYQNGVIGPSFLIDLETAFEAYVRNSLQEAFSTHKEGYAVVDGNKKRWKGWLLNDPERFEIRPDLIFKSGSTIKAVGDVKYKQKSKEEDRYQVISHALSFRCDKAIFVYPASDKVAPGLRRLGRIGPSEFEITLYEYGIPLDGDLALQERVMSAGLMDLCSVAG